MLPSSHPLNPSPSLPSSLLPSPGPQGPSTLEVSPDGVLTSFALHQPIASNRPAGDGGGLSPSPFASALLVSSLLGEDHDTSDASEVGVAASGVATGVEAGVAATTAGPPLSSPEASPHPPPQPSWPPPPTSPLHAYFKPPSSPVSPAEADEEVIRALSNAAAASPSPPLSSHLHTTAADTVLLGGGVAAGVADATVASSSFWKESRSGLSVVGDPPLETASGGGPHLEVSAQPDDLPSPFADPALVLGLSGEIPAAGSDGVGPAKGCDPTGGGDGRPQQGIPLPMGDALPTADCDSPYGRAFGTAALALGGK